MMTKKSKAANAIRLQLRLRIAGREKIALGPVLTGGGMDCFMTSSFKL